MGINTRTHISIKEDAFLLDGHPTYEGRTYRGWNVEGLLLVSRMINGIFDDENPHTRVLWKYPDSGVWAPDRNTRELLENLKVYRENGLTGITIGLQGGSPLAYSPDRETVMKLLSERGVAASQEEVYAGTPKGEKIHPWHNSAFKSDGSLKPDFMERLKLVIEEADEQGIVIVLVLFYFGQDERLKNEEAVKMAVKNACSWVLKQGFTNVLIEINNECNVDKYDHEILKPYRVHELIELAKSIKHNGKRLLVSTSYASGQDGWDKPDDKVVAASDFVLLHGNGVGPEGVIQWVRNTRSLPSYRPMPILFDEDDHYDFEEPCNNFLAAISEYAGWGYFDNAGEIDSSTHFNPALGNYKDGYQNIPIEWKISSERKKAFFKLVKEISGS